MCTIIVFQISQELKKNLWNHRYPCLSFTKHFSLQNRCIRWCTETGTLQVLLCRLKNYGLLNTNCFNVRKKSISYSYYLWFRSYSLPTFTVLELNWIHTQKIYCFFFFCKRKPLGLNNIKIKNATSSKYWGFIIYIQAIIYLLLHDCTFKTSFKVKSSTPIKTTLHMVCVKPDGGLYLPELIFLEQQKTSFKICSD